MDKTKYYITTAIDYLNAPPHLGHAIQKVWADIIARYHRLIEEDVYFLTGSDEYGLSVAKKAESLGKPPKELVDENVEKFISMKKYFNLSWDDFIRTTDKGKHWPGVVAIWDIIQEKGDIYKKKYKGLYCVGHEAFITEKELADGKCPLHGTQPEIVEEENYFFRLSKYTEQIRKEIKSGHLEIIPITRKNEILALLEQGLEDISCSRPVSSLSWGIPIPNDPSHVFYVWFEALINYISALGFGTMNDILFKKYWPANVHVLGKDNLRFHAAIWPGMLISAGLPLPKKIFCHGFVTVNGQKMSKTIGNIVDPIKLVEKYGTDVIRYFMAREITTYDDGDFSEKKLVQRYNGDLANGLGNLVQRILTLIDDKLDGELIYKEELISKEVGGKINEKFGAYKANIENFSLHEAAANIWELINFADKYMDNKKPWAAIKHDEKEFLETMTNLVAVIYKVAWMLLPFMPETADKIFETFGADKNAGTLENYKFRVKKSEGLFPRLK